MCIVVLKQVDILPFIMYLENPDARHTVALQLILLCL